MQPGKQSVRTQLLALHPVTWEKVGELEARIDKLTTAVERLTAKLPSKFTSPPKCKPKEDK